MGKINNALLQVAVVMGPSLGLTKLNSSLSKMSFLQTRANQVHKCLLAPSLSRAAR